MKYLTKALCVLLLAGLPMGCTNLVIGKPIKQDEIKRIAPGLTTTSDIQEWFGAPLRQTQTDAGKIFIYRHLDPNAGINHELILSFSEDDSVCVWSKKGL